MKLKQLEQHLQEVEGFDNPKILLGVKIQLATTI